MATTRPYVWQANDDIWMICGSLLQDSGYLTTETFIRAVRQSNPNYTNQPTIASPSSTQLLYDFDNIPVGTRLIIPFSTS